MSDLNKQKSLTDGKGWKHVIVSHAKDQIKKTKTHVENIIGGIKATPAAIRKTLKKD